MLSGVSASRGLTSMPRSPRVFSKLSIIDRVAGIRIALVSRVAIPLLVYTRSARHSQVDITLFEIVSKSFSLFPSLLLHSRRACLSACSSGSADEQEEPHCHWYWYRLWHVLVLSRCALHSSQCACV